MNSMAADLKELHSLHLKLHEVQRSLERGPKQIQARQRNLAAKQQDLTERKSELIEMRKLADEKSLQLKSNEAKINDLKAKLNSATSNREYDIIRSQIDADEMANSVLEDEILEALDRVDTAQTAVAQVEAELEQLNGDLGTFKSRIEAERPDLEARATDVRGQLKGAEGILTGDSGERYRRLVQAHGAGAMAPVESGACSNCYTTLAPQEKVELNVGKILFCRACGRLLYLDSEL